MASSFTFVRASLLLTIRNSPPTGEENQGPHPPGRVFDPDAQSLRRAPARRTLVVMNRPAHAPARPDAETTPVTPEVEAELRKRLETFDEDAKAARPWEDVLADLKARRPLPRRRVEPACSPQRPCRARSAGSPRLVRQPGTRPRRHVPRARQRHDPPYFREPASVSGRRFRSAARSRPSTSLFDLVQSFAGRVHCRRGAERSERHQIGASARDSEGGTTMTSK